MNVYNYYYSNNSIAHNNCMLNYFNNYESNCFMSLIIIDSLLFPELSMCCTPMKLPTSVYPTMFSRNFESDWMSKEKVGLVCGASSQHFSINWNLRFIKEFNYDMIVEQKLSNISYMQWACFFHVKCQKWLPAVNKRL